MVSFSKKKVITETLGEKLFRFRTEKGVSLEEVACRIKVKKEYLEKIEKNELSALPPDVYVRGYLKKYADFIGLEERVVLEQYQKEQGIQKNLLAFRNPIEGLPTGNRFSFSITPRLLAFFSFLLLFVFSSVYFYQEIKKFSQKPLLVLATSQTNFSVDKDWVEVEGSVEKDSRVLINSQAVLVNEEGRFKEKIFLRKGDNKIVITATNKFKKETTKELEVYAWYESAFSEETDRVNF